MRHAVWLKNRVRLVTLIPRATARWPRDARPTALLKFIVSDPVIHEGQFSMRCVGNLEQVELAARFSRLGLALTARLP